MNVRKGGVYFHPNPPTTDFVDLSESNRHWTKLGPKPLNERQDVSVCGKECQMCATCGLHTPAADGGRCADADVSMCVLSEWFCPSLSEDYC